MNRTSDLYTPQRQSPKAVWLILLKYIRLIVRVIWPVLILILLNPKSNKVAAITTLVVGFTILSLVYSIISYLRYTFFIQENELCVRSGVIRKKILNIPFDRIQFIDFRQNMVHQILNVVQVQVDTAGSKGSELEIDAIERSQAEALRELVFAYKRSKAATSTEAMTDEQVSLHQVPELILSLQPNDLIKVGMSENHLRTAAIIFAFFLGIADDIDQILGWDIYGQLEHTTAALSLVGLLATLIAVPVFIFFSFTITLIRTVFKYYGLKFWREGSNFKVVSGLFTRNEKTIQQSKIQLIRWMTSPLKQLFGIYQMNIYQATNMEHNKDKSLIIPGCYMQQVEHTLDMTVPEFRHAEFRSHRMDISIVYRMVFFFGFIPALVFGLLAWFNHGTMQWLLTLIFPLAVVMGYWYQKKRRFKIHPDFILSESGIIGRSFKLIEIHKIQGVVLDSSPVQRWRGLATLNVHTAGGDISFPYLKADIAIQARDYILYKVEKDHRHWM
jgi:putative membrane protein